MILDSMKNKKHGWYKLSQEHKNILECIVREFVNDDNLEIINFDDVQKVYSINLSVYGLHKVLEDMGYDSDFESDNGWEYDCWYEFTKDECETLVVYGCCISNNMSLYKKWRWQ